MNRFLLSVGLMLCLVLPAWAVKVSSLYQAWLPVNAQAEEIKPEEARLGLLQVLIKLTGNPDISLQPDIQPLLKAANQKVQEFSYISSNSPSQPFFLQIQYDTNSIHRVLKKAGLNYWGENRPLILTWLVIAAPGEMPKILDDEEKNTVQGQIKQMAKQRGLPLIFPVLDVTELSQVSINDILSPALTPLKQTSRRYSPDALLIGNMSMNGDGVESQWELALDNQQWNWRISDDTSEKVISTLMNNIMSTLAKHYSADAVDSKSNWMTLEITRVKEGSDLKNILNNLKQLTSVQQIQLSQVMTDTVLIQVLIKGSLASFQENAELGQHFKLENKTENKLVYEWIP